MTASYTFDLAAGQVLPRAQPGGQPNFWSQQDPPASTMLLRNDGFENAVLRWTLPGNRVDFPGLGSQFVMSPGQSMVLRPSQQAPSLGWVGGPLFVAFGNPALTLPGDHP